MSNYSLILKITNEVMQFVSSEEETFEVHSDAFWVEGPEQIEEGKTEAEYVYDNKEIKLKKITESSYKDKRRSNYPPIQEQLDMLYHDIKNNSLESGEWIKQISSIKSNYPKK